MWNSLLVFVLFASAGAHGQGVSEVNENYKRSVKPIFEKKCFDCHSSTPHLPWYAIIPGPRGLIERDRKDALGDIDMSKDFPFQGKGTPLDYLDVIEDAVKDHSMPPARYWMLHWNSRLTDEDRSVILNWIEKSRATLKRDPEASN